MIIEREIKINMLCMLGVFIPPAITLLIEGTLKTWWVYPLMYIGLNITGF